MLFFQIKKYSTSNGFVKIPHLNKSFQSKSQYQDLKKAVRFISNLKKSKKDLNILFVGTTKHTGQIAKLSAFKTGQFFVGPKWKPGIISNWRQTHHSIKNYNNQKKLMLGYISDTMSSVSLSYKDLPYKKLEQYFSKKSSMEGISSLSKLPDIVVFINPLNNNIPINETQKRYIPSIAFTKKGYKSEGASFSVELEHNSLSEILFLSNTLVNAINK